MSRDFKGGPRLFVLDAEWDEPGPGQPKNSPAALRPATPPDSDRRRYFIKSAIAGSLCLILSIAACANRNVRREWTPFEQTYGELPVSKMQELRRLALSQCDLSRAEKGTFLSRPIYRSGNYDPQTNVPGPGRFCVWNFEKQLIETGDYRAPGIVRSTASVWYGDRLRAITVVRGSTETKRIWYWTARGGQWESALVEVQIAQRNTARTIRLVFSRDSGILVQRAERTGGKKTGIQFNLLDSRGKTCVNADDEETNLSPCPLPLETDQKAGSPDFESDADA